MLYDIFIQTIKSTGNICGEYSSCCDTVTYVCCDNEIKEGDSWLDVLLKFLPTIVVALIAGGIALYQVKSNIISSSRIRWIEDLRSSLSQLYPAALNTKDASDDYEKAILDGDKEKEKYFYAQLTDQLSTFNSLSNKIKMLLNSNESEHKAIEDIINKLDRNLDFNNIKNTISSETEGDLNRIVLLAKIIFKKEWEKSKRVFEI